MEPSEKTFRTIEAALDGALNAARDFFKAAKTDITDWSDRSGRDAYNWTHRFEWVTESGGLIRRAEVSLSYTHPWTGESTPPVTLACRAQVFQRASGVDLRAWEASSLIELGELSASDSLFNLVTLWISRGRREIGEAV